MKTCAKCDEVKSLTEFHKSGRSNGGRLLRRADCKSCAKAYKKAYYGANSEKVKARVKAYYEANSEEIKARVKAYREANSEEIKARKKAWDKTLGAKISAYRSGAKQRNIPFLLTEEEFKSFWQAPCSYCGDEIKTIGLDRIDSDGPYRIDNVRPCCWPCNSNKGTRSLKEWTENTLKRAKMLNPEEFNK